MTFEKPLKLAQAIETANKDIRDLQPRTMEGVGSRSATPLPVHKVMVEDKQTCGIKGNVKKMCRSTPPRVQQRKGEEKCSIKDKKGNRKTKQPYAHHE